MTRILSCDTAHGTCSVALVEDGTIIRQFHDDQHSRQAEQLFNLIDQALGAYSYDDIDALAVNIGPGSFTGIRVGLAALKGLCLVTELPLIPVTSLQALRLYAQNVHSNQAITALIDAGRKQLYMQHFDASGVAHSPELVHVDQFSPSGIIVGNGADTLNTEDNINKVQPPVTCVDKALPNASDIALVAYELWQEQKIAAQEFNGDVLPLYLRAPDAKKMKTAI
ncbi:MAG: tRNA (adenosine(37)-N6)-threonylcarbamoyltransferase complex dimerization subunit type 1 TsaB [Rickettsiales bacterium]|nr:tRNA (adenosine(37)-N6)-threonylcarbamoyltransferase complex dimerization subunit type 1 TsaB [Rickettsiales bacterium]